MPKELPEAGRYSPTSGGSGGIPLTSPTRRGRHSEGAEATNYLCFVFDFFVIFCELPCSCSCFVLFCVGLSFDLFLKTTLGEQWLEKEERQHNK